MSYWKELFHWKIICQNYYSKNKKNIIGCFLLFLLRVAYAGFISGEPTYMRRTGRGEVGRRRRKEGEEEEEEGRKR